MAAGDRDPATRAEAARRRAQQLQQRRFELASGLPPDAGTLARARAHAEESLQRAKRAHLAAAEGHVHAGAAHRRAAAAHEQAAILAGDGAGEAHQDAAEVHRAAATEHDAAAIEQQQEAQAAGR